MTESGSSGARFRGRLLLVDDDPHLRAYIVELLRGEGHAVREARHGREALAILDEERFDLVLTDLVLPELSGLDVLRAVQRDHPGTEVIIITGHGDVDSAVQAIREGAHDYVTKPFHAETFALDVQKALETKHLREDLVALQRQVAGRSRLGDLLGASAPMQQHYRRIEQVAPTDSTVLILGESGTGKEITAREIHRLSRRSGRPFLALNCGALPQSLLESELFGHVRGAFTGATADKVGLVQAADGGTLFLDEIGTTAPRMQVELLRVLDTREVRRVGSTASVPVDVRILAATNVDLDRAMDAGEFRADLYYRLSPVVLRVPPLRERADDVPMLAEHFLGRACRRLGRPARSLSPRVIELLRGYAWPGNVRELEHVLEHAVIFASRPVIRPGDLPETVRDVGAGAEALLSLEEVEARHVRTVLQACGGNKARAAKILGIPRASLYRRLQKEGGGDGGAGAVAKQVAELADQVAEPANQVAEPADDHGVSRQRPLSSARSRLP